jgi:hypothetical protein
MKFATSRKQAQEAATHLCSELQNIRSREQKQRLVLAAKQIKQRQLAGVCVCVCVCVLSLSTAFGCAGPLINRLPTCVPSMLRCIGADHTSLR